MTITNCIITNNSIVSPNTRQADGGGIYLANEVGSTGRVTISNSVIQNNTALDAGGGIFVTPFVPVTLLNTQVLNNQAVGGGSQHGGGIAIMGPSGGAQTAIHGSTISGNQSGNAGGGIYATAGVLIDQGTAITGNHAGGAGGGLWNGSTSETTTVSQATITTNSAAGNGGGIQIDGTRTGAKLSMNFSRVVGNTAVAGNGLNNVSGTVTATDDWWGCNQGPGSLPCDVVSGPATVSPWLVLSNTANPISVAIGNSTVLTAGFLQDSQNNTITPSVLTTLIGLPVTFTNVVGGTLSNAQTSIQPSDTATAALTVTSGPTRVDAVVDNATATANIGVQDFSLAATPNSQTVTAGGGTSYTVSMTSLNGFSGSASLSVSGLPAGATVSFTQSSISGSGSSTLTVNTSSATPGGAASLTITGTSGTTTHTATVTLNVLTFALSATPATQIIPLAASSSFNISVSPSNGFNSNVALSVISSLPSGMTAVFSPNPITGGSGTSTLTIGTTTSTPQGTYALTVQGTSGNDVQVANITVIVQSFTVTAVPGPPSLVVLPGNSGSFNIAVASPGSFTGNVALSASGLPTGAAASFQTNPVALTPNNSFTVGVTVSTTSSTPIGSSTFTVTGTSGTATQTVQGTLTVQDFSVSGCGSVSVVQGSTATCVVTVSPVNGFTGSVALSTSGLPSGVSSSFNPATVTGGSGTSTLTLTAQSSATAGSSSFIIIGTNGSRTRTSSSAITVIPSLAILRPTSATSPGTAYVNPAFAQDGDPTTFANGVVNGGTSVETWSGFASAGTAPTSITLKITSAANCLNTQDGAELAYSLDGGATTHQVYAQGILGADACANRAQQTDSIPLPNNQDTTKVRVIGELTSLASGSTHQIWDIWIEVTH